MSGCSFVVFGAGAVGISGLLLVESRLSLAKELGATRIIIGNDADLVGNIKSITSATQGA